eukprot:5976736-Pyramimonas_sp.AAC.1
MAASAMGATRAAAHVSARPSTSGARSSHMAKCALPKAFASRSANMKSAMRTPLIVRAQTLKEGESPRERDLTPGEKKRLDAGIGSIGLQREGPGGGGQWISTTTRHVHIFAGIIENGDLNQSKLDKLTIDVDPDNEFIWNDDALQKVFVKFDELVKLHKGSPLTDYTLRLIGSDIEHFMRKLLQAGELAYNLQHKAVNYSMGKPRMPLENVPEEAFAKSS